MRRFAVALAVLLAGGIASPARAYGPSTHMREADRFLTFCELQPQTGRQYNPDLLRRERRFLLLGAIWPDIARVVVKLDGRAAVDEGMVDPHNRHFVRWLLENALSEPPAGEWRVAFAQGNLAHLAGDSVSQDMFTEYAAVIAGFGAMDVLVGLADSAPDGENEDIMEGGLEFTEPAVSYYLEEINYFLTTPAGRQELAAVFDYYLTAYRQFFPTAGAGDRERAWATVLDALTDFPQRFPPCARPAGAAAVRNLARDGVDPDRLGGGVTIDWRDFARFLTGPATTRQFWDRYFDKGYFDFSATMQLTFADGQPFFDTFPNWSESLMRASVLQSLAHYLPQQLSVNAGRFPVDLEWYAMGSTTPTTSIDAASPPAGVSLTATFVDSLDAATVSPFVTLVVREDSAAGTVVGSAAANVANDPWGYDVRPLLTLTVEFDPRPSVAAGANGFFAELYEGADDSGLPFLTTNWDIYRQIAEIDMTKAVYANNYAAYGHWPYSLKINVAPATAEVRP